MPLYVLTRQAWASVPEYIGIVPASDAWYIASDPDCVAVWVTPYERGAS